MKIWLKGGLIGGGIWIFLFILDSIRARFIDNLILINILSFPGVQIYVKFIQPNLVNVEIFEDWLIIIPSIVFYIIVGSIMGWIIGKLKSRKK